jgi:hypothetical protein
MKYPPFAIITHKDPALNEAVQTLCFAKKIFWNSGNQEKVRIDPDMAIISNCADRKTATPFIFFNDGYEVLVPYGSNVARFDALASDEFGLPGFIAFLAAGPQKQKPEPKWREWTADEVPIGTEVRNKHNFDRSVIVGVSECTVYLFHGTRYPLKDIFDFWVKSDGTPCGVLEEGGEE